MKLSEILHKYINEGRKGKSDASEATLVKFTDQQLGAMWCKATDLEAAIISLQADIQKLCDRKISLEM